MARVARLTDLIAHGEVTGSIIEGSENTLTNALRTARVGDRATCSVKGHGTPVIVTGSNVTLTNGRPTARVGDVLSCGARIVSGSPDRDIGNDFVPVLLHMDLGVIAPYSERDVVSMENDDTDYPYSVHPPDPVRQAHQDRIEQRDKPRPVEQTDTTPAPPVTPVPTACNFDPSESFSASMQLTPNFKLGDVSSGTIISGARGTGSVRAQQNLSMPEIVCNLKGLCENVLEPLAAKYGRSNLMITSGFRHGSSTSQHEKGMACDIQFKQQFSGMSMDELWERAQWVKANLPYDQFILEYLGMKPWFHLSFNRAASQRRQLLTAMKNGSYTQGLQKLA